MVEKKYKKIDALIRQFAHELKKEIPVEKILLFGSHAQGTAKRDSDIDVLVVSPRFARGRYMEHMQYLFRKAAKVNSLLEPIPAAPGDVENPDKRFFVGQIVPSARVYNFR